MGINSAFGALLVRAKQNGTSFARTVTIGRQSLAIPRDELAVMAQRLKIPMPDRSSIAADGFGDDFLRRFLGVETLTSIDYSHYQGASIIHDLNMPVDASLHRSFDALIDGGTVEHIFDIKQTLTNYMNMVALDGSIFIYTTSNNLCGHGFYQFSPEFFYRVFNNANGYVVENISLIETPLLSVEVSRRQRCFDTQDPAELGQRVQIVNDKPVMVFVHARRVDDEPPFQQPPLQSDYKLKWKKKERLVDDSRESGEQTAAPSRQREFQYVSFWEEQRRSMKQRRKNALKNRRFFKEFVP
jgi:hypothetical protein